MQRASRLLVGGGVLAAALGLGACGTHAASSSATSVVSPSASGGIPQGNESSGIGAWPSFLPTPSAGGVPTGSVASPAMSYPGNAIVLQLGGGTVTALVDGPTYPDDTKVGAEQVSCVFTLVLKGASAPISLKGASFNVLDSQGGIHQMRASIPPQVAPGADATIRITGVLPSGEGLLRFYPTTQGAVAAWDYVAETD